jgi:hypothetical protein
MGNDKTIEFIRGMETLLNQLLGATDVQIIIETDHPEDYLGDENESVLEDTRKRDQDR